MRALPFVIIFGIAHSAASACEPLDRNKVLAAVSIIAKAEGLDANLALAVAEVESASGQNQVSDAGAVGIMQLMPETASDYGVADRCDYQANIRAGIRYLKHLYDEFDDPLLMLAAYNAGPERIYQKGGIPEFPETAKYIVKVMNRWKLHAKATEATLKRGDAAIPKEELTIAKARSSSPWRDAHVWNAE